MSEEANQSDLNPSTDAPITTLFDEMENLIKMLNDPRVNLSDEKVLPLILQKVEEFVIWSKEFEKTTNHFIKVSQVSDEELTTIIQGTSHEIPAEKKALLNRANQLSETILTAMSNLNIAIDPSNETSPKNNKSEYEKVISKEKDDKSAKKRLRKFKKFES